MATVLDRVKALIERLAPEPVCDDCITEKLDLMVRQQPQLFLQEADAGSIIVRPVSVLRRIEGISFL